MQLAMTGTGGQNRDITRANHNLAPILASKYQCRTPLNKTEHLVCGGVVMMEIVHAISPLRRPAIAQKRGLEF
jgi:hypothetical protein